jgi:hypothetical protein
MVIPIDELRSKIDLSIKNNEVLHIKNFFEFNHSWDMHIDILNHQYNFSNLEKIGAYQIQRASDTYTKIIKNSKNFHFHVWDIGKSYITEKDEIISKEINSFINMFIPLLKNKELFAIKSSLNFVGGSQDEFIGVEHSDLLDVLSIQSVGSVNYNIYKPYSKKTYSAQDPIDIANLEKTTYLLEKNDLFFMPKGTIHQVEVFEPRATLILDMENYNASI